VTRINGNDGSPPDPRSNGSLIDLRHVVKTYDTPAGRFEALRGIDLKVQDGEFVSIVGKSGSGKTTLINMLTGIDRPTEGEIFVSGIPVHGLDEGELAAWRGDNMGIVFQFFQLLPTLTALENVRLPMDFTNRYPYAERTERAKQLLGLVGLGDQADTLPSHLSGGQQQRAAIARALANDPPILVADEPTGNLDSTAAAKVSALLERLVGEGKTVLMVTHDQDLAARASRTIALADGEILDK
jgi:putative ABC transport system ATP-binding protein